MQTNTARSNFADFISKKVEPKKPTAYNAALRYLKECNFSVIPVGKDKRPLINWKDFQKRLPTEAELLDWFTRWPDANIGIVTGVISNLAVIDLDEVEIAKEALESLVHDSLTFPVSKTPSGGEHWWFSCSDPTLSNNAKIIAGADLRANGGYVVAPPSVNAEGNQWAWLPALDIFSNKLPPLPDAYIQAIKKPAAINEKSNSVKELLTAGAPEGSRNDSLAKTAGVFLAKGLNFEQTLQNCLAWNLLNKPPLSEGEVSATVESIHKIHLRSEPVEEKKTETQAEWLLKLAEKLPLFHDQYKQPFTFLDGETVPLSSNKVKDYLSYQFYKAEERAANSDSINQALGVLKGKALFENPEIQLSNRIAEKDGAFWYDLLNKKVVKVLPSGWEIINNVDDVDNVDDSGAYWKGVPVLFRRYAHQQPQVEPIKGGDPFRVFDYLNIKKENELLVLVYIISCFVPDIPHPIFHPYGAQGAGKTTLCNIIKKLCDPSSISAIVSPRDATQLIQVLAHHHVCLFDNMSDLPSWMSDILAMASTGGGFSKRQLYTDDEDIVYQVKRCIGLNGINTLISRADLMDRSILLNLERIEPSKRIDEKSLWGNFERQKPYILSGIFDALSKAMAIYPSIKAESLFRMADFQKWGMAITTALGINPNEFIEAYRVNIERQNEEVILNSTLAQAVLSLMSGKDKWEGNIKEAWQALLEISKPERTDKSFPQTEKALRRYLNRLKANLLDAGVTFTIGNRTGEGIPIAFQQIGKSSTSSTSSTSNQGFSVDNAQNVDDSEPSWKGVGVETPCSRCMLTPAMRGGCEVVKPCPDFDVKEKEVIYDKF